MGRCELSRLLEGGKTTLGIVLLGAFIVFVLGIALGLFFARTGGRTSVLSDSILNAVTAIPPLAYLIIMIGIWGNSIPTMTRDVISQEIDALGDRAFLDISFLGKDVIDQRLPEVRDLCEKYAGLDVTRQPIPVQPSVHFFMGGLAVHLNHETNIRNLFAVGECASMYHGANRLGGNSLLAAIYSGGVAASTIAGRNGPASAHPDFSRELEQEKKNLDRQRDTLSPFPIMYVRDMLADTMQKRLGIVRDEANLGKGLEDIDYYLSIAERIRYDSSVMPYFNYSLTAILTLARATVTCALSRRESRGAHYRSDFPETDAALQSASIIAYDGGDYRVRLDEERAYES